MRLGAKIAFGSSRLSFLLERPAQNTNTRRIGCDQSDAFEPLPEDYLDYLCAPLLGIVPYAQRRRLRLETEDHLLALVEDFGAEGFAPDQAVTVALREYGEPWRIGQDFAEAWLTGPHPCHFARFTDAATLRAFGWFGVFSILSLLGVEQCALVPNQQEMWPLVQCLRSSRPSLRVS